jgi:hypothetical protein
MKGCVQRAIIIKTSDAVPGDIIDDSKNAADEDFVVWAEGDRIDLIVRDQVGLNSAEADVKGGIDGAGSEETEDELKGLRVRWRGHKS